MRLKFTLTHCAPSHQRSKELLQENVCPPQSFFLSMYVCPHRKYKECMFKFITGILFGTLFYNLFFHLTWCFRLEGLNSESSLWFHSPEGRQTRGKRRSLCNRHGHCHSVKLSDWPKVTQLLNVGLECGLWSSDSCLCTLYRFFLSCLGSELFGT